MKKIFTQILITVVFTMFLVLSIFSELDFFKTPFALIAMLFFLLISSIALLSLIVRYYIVSINSQKYIVIPEFSLKEAEFYELSLLMDGDISVDDVMAMMVYYSHFPKSDDPIVTEMSKYISPHSLSLLYRIHYLGIETEEEGNANVLNIFTSKIKQPILEKLKEKKFFRFNPEVVKNIGMAVIVSSILPLLGILIFESALNNLVTISLGLILIGVTIINSAPLFYENLGAVLNIRARVKGYQMYLKTVEWYTVEKDMERFFEHVPFFLLFNQKKEHLDKIIELTLNKFQLQGQNPTN